METQIGFGGIQGLQPDQAIVPGIDIDPQQGLAKVKEFWRIDGEQPF